MSQPFRYQRVQRVRAIEEELAREEFLARERVARHAEEAADTMQAEIDRAHQELSETRMFKRVPPHELLTAQSTLENLDATLAEQRRRARDLRQEAEGMRASWESRRADVKSLERLEERFAANALEEERKAEAKQLDELATRPNASALQPEDDAYSAPHSDPRDLADDGQSSSEAGEADEEDPLHRT